MIVICTCEWIKWNRNHRGKICETILAELAEATVIKNPATRLVNTVCICNVQKNRTFRAEAQCKSDLINCLWLVRWLLWCALIGWLADSVLVTMFDLTRDTEIIQSRCLSLFLSPGEWHGWVSQLPVARVLTSHVTFKRISNLSFGWDAFN